MEDILVILRSDTFLIIFTILIILLFLSFIFLIIRLSSLNKKYKKFLGKLGNGKNIEEDLENYMHKVQKVERQNVEIIEYANNLDENMAKCIQKVGIVRYNAFKDTGSDLSFTLAMLDENNDGIVLNGIYSREMSNIYAKSIEKGASNYILSEEETLAINKAINS